MFRALFQYLPLRDSPNENPQLELSLQPGDVVLVNGEMDTDGFYRGETLDGRNGLVPSNYVERVPDSLLLANARAPSPSFPLRVPQHLSSIEHDFSSPDHSTLPDSVCPYPPADVTKVTVQEIKNVDTPRIPCPREVIVEKKLSRSVLVSWSPPEESFVAVSQYHVCVDGAVRAIVPGSYKCRALVEDINLDGSVNLSVRAMTEHGHSPDAACTIAVGNEAQVAPQQVRVWQVTPVSACIRWYPSNSNAEHVVSLNAVKVGVCPPTVFQVQLQGLCPSTIYRVSVRTKHPKAVLEQRPVERCIDFKTLPKIGLPDPPSHVQVEVGPQPGTLLVSWQPVGNQPKPPSRAAVHSYLVYADGKNIAQVPNASADHVLLRLADLSDDPPIFLTVRTKTKEGAVSSDSNVARVPRSAFGFYNPGTSTQEPPQPPQSNEYSVYNNCMMQPLNGMVSAGAAVVQNGVGGAAGHAPSALMRTLSQHQLGIQQQQQHQQQHQQHQQQNEAVNPMYAGIPSGPAGMQSVQPSLASLPAHLATQCSISALSGLQQQQQQQIPPQHLLQHQHHLGTLKAQTSGGLLTSSAPATSTSLLQQQQQQQINPYGTLKKNKYMMGQQYYTFHPSLLHTEPTTGEELRPSVLEMENSYLSRHRHQQDWWTNAPESRDARNRIEAYSRDLARVASADERMAPPLGAYPPRRIVPPRLARVKTESGFGTRSEPDLRPPILEDDCRWFVALFDYSHHMSPNANAEIEELSFRKHQLIKVFGEVDPDGFYQGQIGNRIGLVPSNMVIEIAKDEMVMPRRTMGMPTTTSSAAPSAAAPPTEPSLRRMRWGSLKSRSYDYAGDRRGDGRGGSYNAMSLDRRGTMFEERERYRRPAGGYRRRRDEPDYDDDPEYYRSRRGPPPERYRDASLPPPRVYEDPRRVDHRRGPSEDRYPRDEYRREKEDDGYDYRQQQPPPQMAPQQPSAQGYYQPPQQQAPPPLQPPQPQQYQYGEPGPAFPLQQHHQPQMQLQQPQMQLQQQQQQQQPGMDQMPQNGMTTRRMIAKFDYDSRQLSPNVDAEQVELSFRQGDVITVYGEMDEDGFFMGELNGLRGLVPSNFLQNTPLTSLGPSQPPPQMMQEPQTMRKGVAFSDASAVVAQTSAIVRKIAPTRQSSQTGPAPAAKPAAKKSTAGQGAAGKTLTKKTSDVGKTSAAVRKTSTAVKKNDSNPKKK